MIYLENSLYSRDYSKPENTIYLQLTIYLTLRPKKPKTIPTDVLLNNTI